MIRKVVVALSTSAVALVIACSSDNTSSGSGTSSSGASSTSSSGSSGSGTASGFKQCSTGSSSSSKCTEAEFKPYTDCYSNNCDTKYKECFGADYKSGTFSGACGTWVTCTQKCDCSASNYASCITACTQDSACTECSKGFLACGNGCTLPACATGGTPDGGGGGGATCADLTACCAKLSGADKSSCDAAKNAAGGADAVCGPLYTSLYKAKCP